MLEAIEELDVTEEEETFCHIDECVGCGACE